MNEFAGLKAAASDATAQAYCHRLAAILLRYDYLPDFRQALTLSEQREILKSRKHTDLLQHLLGSPRLQSIAASRTSYTPSVWLLEQELVASGNGNLLCGTSSPKCRHGITLKPCDVDAKTVYKVAGTVNGTGLCFSGGGIRSATFNLGILQGLASLGLLNKFRYLSTVSGGGYIHQFYAAWLRNNPRQAQNALREVQHKLKPLPGNPPLTEQPEPIRWLRRYSNYLTPNKGIFTTDTWVLVAVWLRNTFLIQLNLVASLAFLITLPQLFVSESASSGLIHELCGAMGFLVSILIVGLGLAATCLTSQALETAKTPPAEGSNRSHWQAALCLLFLLSFLATPRLSQSMSGIRQTSTYEMNHAARQRPTASRVIQIESKAAPCSTLKCLPNKWLLLLWNMRSDSSYKITERAFLLVAGLFCFFVGRASIFEQCEPLNSRERDSHYAYLYFILFLATAVAVLTAWGALHAARIGFGVSGHLQRELIVVFFPVTILAILFLSAVVTAGIVGRLSDDALREALARLRAEAFLVSLIWIALTGFSLLGPMLFHWLIHVDRHAGYAALTSWIGSTIAAVLAGKSSKSSSFAAPGGFVLKLLIAIGPPVFLFGLLLVLSAAVKAVLVSQNWDHNLVHFCLFMASLAAVALLFGLRLDINDFSMHAFYRDRLARCYVGASYPHRRPDRFTGFARTDGEILVAELLPAAFSKGSAQAVPPLQDATPQAPYEGPFPIFCSAVNLTFGQDLAWQERKAASFAFTPLYTGYSAGWTSDHVINGKLDRTYNGFVETRNYAYDGGGIPLHSAVAISGAAVSPNWGYHTDPAMAFLLTMFNVRLGWWIRNPRVTKRRWPFDVPSPPFPLLNLFSELLGHATDVSPYVYLTDGGHFDNMGLYELVRRRCRRILICDAEQDGTNSFEGIGMAIRKCRVDFAVEVDINLRALDPRIVDPAYVPPAALAPAHFAEGTIRYPEDSPDTPPGVVIYIKSSITGDEPGDVLNYKRQHDGFPHEPTADQWFTESQFESYRRLGYHIIQSAESLPSSPGRFVPYTKDSNLGQRLAKIFDPS